MSVNLPVSILSSTECMGSGRAQLPAQNLTITRLAGSNLPHQNTCAQDHNKNQRDPSSCETVKKESKGTYQNCHDSIMTEIQNSMASVSLHGHDGPSAEGSKDAATTPEHSAHETEPNALMQQPNLLPVSGRDGKNFIVPAASAGTSSGTSQPIIVISQQDSQALPLDQPFRPSSVLVDDPDPRLVDALRNPRDRPFVLRLEQDVVAFITGNALLSFDSPSVNSYYRMLVHKLAEYYRLNHISSPDAEGCVKLLRCSTTRIPRVRLVEISTSKSPESQTPPPSTQLAVKIMRRRSPSEKSNDSSVENGGSGTKGVMEAAGGDSVAKAMTREEKETAYQLARARIFGDFKESPPDSPVPVKASNEKQASQRKNKDLDDGFQSRSQFVPIPQPYTPHDRQAGNPSIMGFLGPMPGPPGPSTHLNPAASSFNPNAGAFSPQRLPMPAPAPAPAPVAQPPPPPPPLPPPVYPQQLPGTFPQVTGYPMQQQQPHATQIQFPYDQHTYNRPMLPPNMQPFPPQPMARVPSGPTPNYGGPLALGPRLNSAAPTFTPSVVSAPRPPPHYGQAHNNYYMPRLGPNKIVNGGFNMGSSMSNNTGGGWVHNTAAMQHGTLPHSEGSLTNHQNHNGGFGPYGVGR